jgi:hypothetical protein
MLRVAKSLDTSPTRGTRSVLIEEGIRRFCGRDGGLSALAISISLCRGCLRFFVEGQINNLAEKRKKQIIRNDETG